MAGGTLGRRIARARPNWAAAAVGILTPLKASGARKCVAYFRTEKFTPQMIAINSSRASVRTCDSDGRALSPAVAACEVVATVMSESRRIGAALAAAACDRVCLVMHVSFALFADAANLSQEGKLNILGVFDAVQVGTIPTVHPRAHLVVRLKGSAQDAGIHTVSLRWTNPHGEELWSSVGELEVAAMASPMAEMDLPVIAAIDLPLDQAGSYLMRISLDDQPHAEVGLLVRAAPPQFVAPAGSMVS